MTALDFNHNYFELFELPLQFDVDLGPLGERYRQLQRQFHPDRFAAADASQQRVAMQYSSLVNQAHDCLRHPLSRALYLLELQGMDRDMVAAQKVDGGFLIEQMELRERLECLDDLVDPGEAIDHLLCEIRDDARAHENEFAVAYAKGVLDAAASAAVKMQYLDKLQAEAEQAEATLLD